jgi:hypothetical protein
MNFDDIAQIEAFTEYLRSAAAASSEYPSGERATGHGRQSNSAIKNPLNNPSFRLSLSLATFVCAIAAFNNHELFFA